MSAKSLKKFRIGRSIIVSIMACIIGGWIYLRVIQNSNRCKPERHIFHGVVYNVELCGSPNKDSNFYGKQLQVYSKDDELLAARYFTFVREPDIINYVHYKDGWIEYSDDEARNQIDAPVDKTLNMPPTLWDRVSANVHWLILGY